MRRPLTWIAGLGLAVFLIGLSVVPLTIPAFTRVLSSRVSLAEEAGLPRQQIVSIAEQVREFVVDGDTDTLPTTVDGRDGFDASAVSHLRDVRRVLAAARVATGVLAALLALALGVEVARKRTDRIADALLAGAVCSAVLVAVALLAAASDFEAFFSAFHGVFFTSGTWTFSYDSLLIQTFPEPFWVTCGAVWAGLVAVGAAAMAVGAVALRRGYARHAARSASRHSQPPLDFKA